MEDPNPAPIKVIKNSPVTGRLVTLKSLMIGLSYAIAFVMDDALAPTVIETLSSREMPEGVLHIIVVVDIQFVLSHTVNPRRMAPLVDTKPSIPDPTIVSVCAPSVIKFIQTIFIRPA